jgi:2-keto-4-pentenoate hydratase/2-oxohepta-3-ene-1,7-dioic acid hydratase in catechol pathway
MPRTLLRYITDDAPDTPRWGVLFGASIAPLGIGAIATGCLLTEHWERIWSVTPAQATLPRAQARLLAPVTTDQQFICQGVNYRSHVEESGLKLTDFPFNTIFTKSPSCITAADAPVARPRHVRLLDYEIELGLVLRRDLPADAQVSADALGTWLAGVTIVNDLSARDVQLPQGQFYKGKSYRGFGPVGPGLVLLTPEEWRRWPELHMRLTVNGQPRQAAYCREMINAPAATLTELAAMHDVNAGDLIATGTPAGCAARAPGRLAMFVLRHLVSDATKWRLFIRKGLANPAYLRPGDRLNLSIRTDDGAIDLGEQATVITAA